MIRLCAAAALIAVLAAPAVAQPQPAPSPFAPITIDQKTYEEIRRALGQIRFDDALPLVIYWENLERTAITRAKEQAPTKPAD